VFGEEPVAVDYSGGDVDEFAVIDSRVLAQKFVGVLVVDGVAFHQAALGALDQRSAGERAFEVVVFGEASQHDVD
jgi:hypothetical protein